MRPNSLLGSLPACDASLPRSRDRSSPLRAQFTVAPGGLGLPPWAVTAATASRHLTHGGLDPTLTREEGRSPE